MNVAFTPQGWDDYLYWQETDPRLCSRIHHLIKDALRDPRQGIGKPEPLRHSFQGCWSRRITGEHRMGVSGCERRTVDYAASLSLLKQSVQVFAHGLGGKDFPVLAGIGINPKPISRRQLIRRMRC